jgi:HD-GYP domain-containing protein (c-di-GMP phosphodiesterase class II)
MTINEEVDIRKLSVDLVNQFAVVLRTAQLHDTNNIAVVSAVDKLVSIVNTFIRYENVVDLEIRGEFFYINETRVRYPLEHILNFDFLIREFKLRDLGGIRFSDKALADDITSFINVFNATSASGSPFDVISDKMSGIRNMLVRRLKHIVEEENYDIRKMVKKNYFNAVSLTKGVMNKIKSGEKENLRKSKRVVETMVDHILEEEQLLIGMTSIKDYDDYTYHHSVNVSILAIALGQRLGLNRKMLTELGMSALFHDFGKIYVPYEVLNKPTSFTDSDWKVMRKHPAWGVRTLLSLRKIDPSSIRASIVAFEHHMNTDHSGYPRLRKNTPLDLFSRIVMLADQYDAMTSARVYARTPMAPDKALSIMMERSDHQIDRLLFKIFVNMVGVYPIGTFIMLNSNELGLVYETNNQFATRPRVMLITDNKGNSIQGKVIDLTDKDPQGEYLRTIVKTLDPNKYGINLAEYLL